MTVTKVRTHGEQTMEQHKTLDDARLDDIVSIANFCLTSMTVHAKTKLPCWMACNITS